MDKAGRTVARRQKKTNTRRATMIGITFVVMVLFVSMLILTSSLHKKVEADALKKAAIEQQILDEQARTGEIEDLEDYMKSDEYIEQVAKDKLGMVNDGEIIFKQTD
jgi:cell division protein DivIC